MRISKKAERVFLLLLKEAAAAKIDEALKDFSKADYQELYNLIITTRLLPLFYSRLSALSLKNIEHKFLLHLNTLYLLNLKRNIILNQELGKILVSLREKNIPVIPLKGPVLAKYLYHDLALRQTSNDLDLLVPYEKIDAAEAFLRRAGFINKKEGNLQQRPLVLKYAKALHLEAKIEGLNNYLLDLHWDLRGSFHDTNLESFWRNSRQINFGSFEVLMPKAEDLLLYLANCAIFNLEFVRLKYLYDIHTLISKKEVSWQALKDKAEGLGMSSCLYFVLSLSRDFFHTHIPEKAMSSMRPNFIKENLLKIWLKKKNVLYEREVIAKSYLWRYFVSSYLYSKSILDCLRIIYKKIFLPVQDVGNFVQYAKRLFKPFRRLDNEEEKKVMETAAAGYLGAW